MEILKGCSTRRHAEFYSHISPDMEEWVYNAKKDGRAITFVEWQNLRINSYEKHFIIPYLDDDAVLHIAQYCYDQAGYREFSDHQLPAHYGESVIGVWFPLLIERLRAKQDILSAGSSMSHILSLLKSWKRLERSEPKKNFECCINELHAACLKDGAAFPLTSD